MYQYIISSCIHIKFTYSLSLLGPSHQVRNLLKNISTNYKAYYLIYAIPAPLSRSKRPTTPIKAKSDLLLYVVVVPTQQVLVSPV